MTTQEIAKHYVTLFKQGNSPLIHQQLYSTDVVCTEPEHAAAMGVPTITKGLDAVMAKSKAMGELIAEVHSFYCTEPVAASNHFSVAMGRELTFKNGHRIKRDEIAVFGVKDDKIVSETFFY